MSFFNSIFTLLGQDNNVLLGTREGYINERIPELLGNKNSFSLGKADNVSTLYTCVKILSDNISLLPIQVMITKANGEREPAKKDPLYPVLLYDPNGYTTSQKFFATLEYWRNIKGNAFARINRNTRGTVKSLELVPPSWVKSYTKVNGELYYNLVIPQEGSKEVKKVTLNSNDILHFTNVTVDGIWGINPIERLRLNLSSSYKGLKTIDSFYENNATTAKALKFPAMSPNRKNIKQQESEFAKDYAGAANAGKMMTLPDGAEIVDLQLSFGDQQFIETVKFNSNQIASAFGVPLYMVGNTEGFKYSQVEQVGLELKKTFAPILRMYKQEMESKMFTTNERINGKSIDFQTDALIEIDIKTKTEVDQNKLMNGQTTPNQLNRKNGIPTYPEGDKHWIPSTMVFVEGRGENQNVDTQT